VEALDLRDVTLVGNDAGGALFVVTLHSERIGRLVLTNCDAFDNYPPAMRRGTKPRCPTSSSRPGSSGWLR
jgi:pimeloyl-ACP methyl ester carboxylesterase